MLIPSSSFGVVGALVGGVALVRGLAFGSSPTRFVGQARRGVRTPSLVSLVIGLYMSSVIGIMCPVAWVFGHDVVNVCDICDGNTNLSDAVFPLGWCCRFSPPPLESCCLPCSFLCGALLGGAAFFLWEMLCRSVLFGILLGGAASLSPLSWEGGGVVLLYHLVILGGAASLVGLSVVFRTDHFRRSKKSGSPKPLTRVSFVLLLMPCVLLLGSFGITLSLTFAMSLPSG